MCGIELNLTFYHKKVLIAWLQLSTMSIQWGEIGSQRIVTLLSFISKEQVWVGKGKGKRKEGKGMKGKRKEKRRKRKRKGKYRKGKESKSKRKGNSNRNRKETSLPGCGS